MKTKKLFAVVLMLCIMLSVAGCGKETGATGDETTKKKTESTTDGQTTEAVTENKKTTEAATEGTAQNVTEATTDAAAGFYEQGRAYLYGLNGTSINYKAAKECFEEAVRLGNQDANFYMGVLYDWCEYPELDYEMARAYYYECPDNVYAEIALAFNCYYGQGMESDPEKGLHMFQTVIDSGYAEGYFGLAEIENDKMNYEKAMEYYNKALEGTEPLYVGWAMNVIGIYYFYGNDIERDYLMAKEWWEKAADLGNTYAMENIANLYATGFGVGQDDDKAAEWYDKAANANK